MDVIATKPGYFGKLRAVGDKFEVPDGTKGSWFEPVKEEQAEKKSGAKKAAQGGNDLV